MLQLLAVLSWQTLVGWFALGLARVFSGSFGMAVDLQRRTSCEGSRGWPSTTGSGSLFEVQVAIWWFLSIMREAIVSSCCSSETRAHKRGLTCRKLTTFRFGERS